MNENIELKVWICRQPGNQYGGEYEVSKIWNPHWDTVSGGVHSRSGSYHLFGYIPYSDAKNLVKCSGRHDYGSNDAKICILKSSNSCPEYIDGYKQLVAEAGPKPTSIVSRRRPTGKPPCTKAILAELNKNDFLTRKDLRQQLLDSGYYSNTILGAIRRLTQQNKIILSGSSHSPKQIIKINGSLQ